MRSTLTLKLRFPEFREEWNEVPLSHLAISITDRVGTMSCVPYTVTSGVGLVSQEKKFGRTIAGNSLRNYIRLQKDDFAYNKSATKAYPEGYIARYLDEAKAAVPNSIFTCFRVDSERVVPAYLDFLFAGNLHGRWLRRFLAIGARAHGSLNVSDDDLMALPVPLPSLPEQQKIADCLGSLDFLIATERRKLAALRDHKRGLMQQLFPQPGETQPRLRFPEFRGKAEWEAIRIGDLNPYVTSGSRGWAAYYARSGALFVRITNLTRDSIYLDLTNSKFVSLPAEANEGTRTQLRFGDILISITADIGIVGYVDACVPAPAYINQHIALVRLNESTACSRFVAYHLATDASHRLFSDTTDNGTKAGMNLTRVQSLPLFLPALPEQTRIADCLASLDSLISAQAAKVDALTQHKRGLMQQLFPVSEVS